ncbi:hypothetical protein Tco_1252498 [Tanacetum coccineum]
MVRWCAATITVVIYVHVGKMVVKSGCTTASDVVPWETDGESVLRESCSTRASMTNTQTPPPTTTVVNSTGAPVTNTVANHAERPEKFNETVPQVEPPVESQSSNAQAVQAVEAWKHSGFLCHNYVLNGLIDPLYNVYCKTTTAKELSESLERKYKTEDAGTKKFVVAQFLDYKMVDSKNEINQVQDLQVLLHDIHAEKMILSETFQVAAIIEKLPPSWVEFKNYLKHKRKEMSVEDLVVRLRIQEDNKLAQKDTYTPDSAKLSTDLISLYQELFDLGLANSSPMKQVLMPVKHGELMTICCVVLKPTLKDPPHLHQSLQIPTLIPAFATVLSFSKDTFSLHRKGRTPMNYGWEENHHISTYECGCLAKIRDKEIDDDLQDERQDQTDEEEVEPRRSKRARNEKSMKDILTVIEGYSDSNWISDIKDSRSTSAEMCLHSEVAAISWKTSKQTCISKSTMESVDNMTEEDEAVESGDISILNSLIGQGSMWSLQLWGKESLERKYKTEDAGTKKFVVLLHDIHAEGMALSETFQVAAIIEKLPPSWVEFKNYLKHKRKKMSVKDLVVRLGIEEDNKMAQKNTYTPDYAKANMVEHAGSSSKSNSKAKGKGKGKSDKKGKGKAEFPTLKAGIMKQKFQVNPRQANMVNDNMDMIAMEYNVIAMISEVNLVGSNNSGWWVDIGATCHVCADKSMFHSFRAVDNGEKLYTGNSTIANIKGEGDVIMKMTFEKEFKLTYVI